MVDVLNILVVVSTVVVSLNVAMAYELWLWMVVGASNYYGNGCQL